MSRTAQRALAQRAIATRVSAVTSQSGPRAPGSLGGGRPPKRASHVLSPSASPRSFA